MTAVRIVFTVELAGASPSEVRARFLAALKTAIVNAQTSGRIDLAIAEELFRALPQLRDA